MDDKIFMHLASDTFEMARTIQEYGGKIVPAINTIKNKNISIENKCKLMNEVYRFSIYGKEKFIDPRAEQRYKEEFFAKIDACTNEAEAEETIAFVKGINDSLRDSIDKHYNAVKERVYPNSVM